MNHFQAIVAALERDWPDWQVWYVPKAIGGMTWCARRWDGSGRVVNADSPNELVELLEAEAGDEQHPGRAPCPAEGHLSGVADHRYRRWLTAVERSTGRTITADTVTELETRLARF